MLVRSVPYYMESLNAIKTWKPMIRKDKVTRREPKALSDVNGCQCPQEMTVF